MTRARRVALLSAIFSVTYILVLFAFIPVPFVAKEHAEQILPVVRCLALMLVFRSKGRPVTMVVACVIWLICALVSRARRLHIPRMHGRVYGVIDCTCRVSDLSFTRFTMSSGNNPSKIGATSQRSLCRLVGGYIYMALE